MPIIEIINAFSSKKLLKMKKYKLPFVCHLFLKSICHVLQQFARTIWEYQGLVSNWLRVITWLGYLYLFGWEHQRLVSSNKWVGFRHFYSWQWLLAKWHLLGCVSCEARPILNCQRYDSPTWLWSLECLALKDKIPLLLFSSSWRNWNH